MIEYWRDLLRVFFGSQVDEYTKTELIISLGMVALVLCFALVVQVLIL